MRTSLSLALLAAMVITTRAPAGDFSATVRTAKGEAVADAAVALIPLDATVAPPSGTPAELAQQDQEYSAYVTIVQTGSKVTFPNKDTVQHHVYSLSKAKKFELPLYNPGSAESFVFDVSGVVALGCNIHDWMLAYLVVVPTPYFGKSDAKGRVHVTAPDGRYRLELWHPRLATPLTEEVNLAASASVDRDFNLTLKPDRRVRRGPDSKAGAYR
jgi:plastocyanin